MSLIEKDPTQERNSFKWSASTAIGFFTFLSIILSLYLFAFPGGKDKVSRVFIRIITDYLEIKEDPPCSQRLTSVTFLRAIFVGCLPVPIEVCFQNILTKLISSILMALIRTENPVIQSLSHIRPVCPVILLTTILVCDVLFLVIHENFEVSGYNVSFQVII